METWDKKKSVLWLSGIVVITIIAGIVAGVVTNINPVSKIIGILIGLFIPISIELLRKKDPVKYYGLDFVSLKNVNIKLVIGIAVLIFAIVAIIDNLYFHLWSLVVNPNSKVPIGSDSTALARSNIFYLAIFTVSIGTLMEELWFRGLIQYKIKAIRFLNRINPHFAIIIQSILFGLVHFLAAYYGTDLPIAIKVYFFVYPAVIGLILGYTNERYNSLWPGWIMHFTNNFLMVIGLTIYFRLH